MKGKLCGVPDGQWKWVVVFATFSISLIMGGLYRSTGILLVAFINEFGVSRKEASLPLIVYYTVVDFTGILVGSLGHVYGIRSVTIAGSILGAVGLSACFLAPDLNIIALSFAVYGFGFSLSHTLIPVIISQYFSSNKSTVNGIVFSGACFGSIMFPLFFKYLTYIYGLRGSLLLASGIILQISVCGALMRPPFFLGKHQDIAKSIKYSQIAEECVNDIEITEVALLREDKITTGIITKKNIEEKAFDEQVPFTDFENAKTMFQDGGIVCFLENDEQRRNNKNKIHKLRSTDRDILYKSVSEKSESSSSSNKLNYKENIGGKYSLPVENIQNSVDVSVATKFSQVGEMLLFQSQSINTHTQKKSDFNDSESHESDDELTDCPNKSDQHQNFNRTSKFVSLNDFHAENDNNTKLLYFKKLSNASNSGISSHEVEGNLPSTAVSSSYCTKIRRSLSILEIFKCIFSCPMFYVYAITRMVLFFNFHMFLVINVDYYLDRGVADSDTKYSLISFSFFDLFGRLSLGWITDKNYLKRSHFLTLTIAGMAALFFSFPFLHGFLVLNIISSLYGFLQGCTLIVHFVALSDYLDLEMQGVAFGCVNFLGGTTTLMFIFIIGYFRDKLGSYSSIFFLMGSTSLTASALWPFERYFLKVKDNNRIYTTS